MATKVEEVAVAGAEKVEGLVGGVLGGAAAAAESTEASANAVVEDAAKSVPAVSVEVEVRKNILKAI